MEPGSVRIILKPRSIGVTWSSAATVVLEPESIGQPNTAVALVPGSMGIILILN
jgi:hypothetical protein